MINYLKYLRVKRKQIVLFMEFYVKKNISLFFFFSFFAYRFNDVDGDAAGAVVVVVAADFAAAVVDGVEV